MKKVLAILLSLAMIISLAACNQTQESTAATEAPTTETPAPTTEPVTETEPAAEYLTYEEFLKADLESEVSVKGHIQTLAYSAEYGTASLFLADTDGGAYYVYRMAVTEEEAAKLALGEAIIVTGYKTEWSGEVEISEASFKPADDGSASFFSAPVEVTAMLGTDDLAAHMNARVSFTNGTVVASADADGKEAPFLYTWNGSGEAGQNCDLYFNVAFGGEVYTFTVESDETPEGSDVYTAVTDLSIGDRIDMEGFLYWYNGAQPHIHSVKESDAKGEGVMTKAEYDEAALESEVVIEAYIQCVAYSAEYGTASLFLQDNDGAYFVYRMNVNEVQAQDLEVGAKLRVTGYKSEWAGEIEIADASFERLDGSYLYEAADVTKLLEDESELIAHMNERVSFRTMRVEASVDADGNELPFLYKYNGSGVEGDDLYFNVSIAGGDGEVYTFMVETDECPQGSDVYTAVTQLSIGDVIDLEGFLYWYEGPQPHIYSVTEAAEVPPMTWGEFMYEAEVDDEVTIRSNIQGIAYNAEYGTASLFLADPEGAYYVYRMPVTEEEAALLEIGAEIIVTGYKAEWAGEIEIAEATFTMSDGESYISEAHDFGPLMNEVTNDGIPGMYMNNRIALKKAIVVPSVDADGNEAAFLYSWNGSGAAGQNSDLYFNVEIEGKTYTLTVESDECPEGSDVYTAVTEFFIGEAIDIEAFLYWYEGPQPHVYSVDGEAYAKSEGVLTYYQYAQAELEEEVVIEAYVTMVVNKESDGMVCLYLDDLIGGYYVYNMPVSEEELAQLKENAKIRVTGYKSEWSGMVEITDATFELLDGRNPEGVFAYGVDRIYGDPDAVAAYLARKVWLSNVVIVPSVDADGNEAAFLYNWNGSGEAGQNCDLYFNIRIGTDVYTVTLDSDECPEGSDAYTAVTEFKVYDVVDLAGFLYWYNAPQLHVTDVDTQMYEKPEGVMNYGEYLAAERDEEVTIQATIQHVAFKETPEDTEYAGELSLFLYDVAGAYYVYGLKVTEEEKEELYPDVIVKITGTKTEWSGLVEIVDAAWEVVEAAEAYDDGVDITAMLGDESLIDYMNRKVFINGATVVASEGPDGKDAAFLYSWNGSGAAGQNSDLYFNVEVEGEVYTLTLESTEFPEGSEEYTAITELKIGDVIDIIGYLYWYNGPQPHVGWIELVEE